MTEKRILQVVIAFALIASTLSGAPIGFESVGTAAAATSFGFNGDYDGWDPVNQGADSTSIGIVDFVSYEGSHSVEFWDNDNGGGAHSTIRTPDTVRGNFAFEYRYFMEEKGACCDAETGTDTIVQTLWNDSYRLYHTEAGTATGEIRLVDQDTGATLDKEKNTTWLQNGEWGKVSLTMTNGDLTYQLYDQNGTLREQYSYSFADVRIKTGHIGIGVNGQYFSPGGEGYRYYIDYVTNYDVTALYEVSGTVNSSADGTLLSGATVAAYQNGNEIRSTTTSGGGDYSLYLKDGNYEIRADTGSYSESTETVTINGAAETVDVSLAPYRLRIRSLNQSQFYIPDADVTIKTPSGSTITDTTNSTGWYYTLPQSDEAGTYTVTVNSKGFASKTTTVDLTEATSDKYVPVKLTRAGAPYVLEARPRDGTYEPNRSNVTLRTLVKDPDGDDVTVELYHKNSTVTSWTKVNDTTVASGGLVTADVNATQGRNEWFANLTDTDGISQNSTEYYYDAPGYIRVRYDSNLTLMTGVNVTANFTSLDTAYRSDRNTTTGIVDMNTVPKGPTQVRLNATNYTRRTLVFSDPSKNYTTTLVNLGAAVRQAWELDDKSGNYPVGNSYVTLSRVINGTYQRVASGYFGADNLARTWLVKGRTYKLAVRNFAGDEYGFGSYIQEYETDEQTITLTIPQNPDGGTGGGDGLEDISTNTSGVIRYGASLNETGKYIWFRYSDRRRNTTELGVTIWEHGNKSNQIFEGTYTDLGNITDTTSITSEQANQTWVVYFNASRTSEPDPFEAKVIVGRDTYAPGVPLSPAWAERLGILSIFFVAAIVGGITDKNIAAIMVTLWAGFLSIIGWIPGAISGLMIVGTLCIVAMLRMTGVGDGGGV